MTQNSEELKAFIRENSQLFWYTPEKEKENIGHELLVEQIFNYGTLDAVRKLLTIMGIRNVANVFFGMQGRKKLNFFPEIHNYFTLFFSRYA